MKGYCLFSPLKYFFETVLRTHRKVTMPNLFAINQVIPYYQDLTNNNPSSLAHLSLTIYCRLLRYIDIQPRPQGLL